MLTYKHLPAQQRGCRLSYDPTVVIRHVLRDTVDYAATIAKIEAHMKSGKISHTENEKLKNELRVNKESLIRWLERAGSDMEAVKIALQSIPYEVWLNKPFD